MIEQQKMVLSLVETIINAYAKHGLMPIDQNTLGQLNNTTVTDTLALESQGGTNQNAGQGNNIQPGATGKVMPGMAGNPGAQ